MVVEPFYHQNRSRKPVTIAILLKSNILADGCDPNLAFAGKGIQCVRLGLNIFLQVIPCVICFDFGIKL